MAQNQNNIHIINSKIQTFMAQTTKLRNPEIQNSIHKSVSTIKRSMSTHKDRTRNFFFYINHHTQQQQHYLQPRNNTHAALQNPSSLETITGEEKLLRDDADQA
jgi:hypothetical protein